MYELQFKTQDLKKIMDGVFHKQCLTEYSMCIIEGIGPSSVDRNCKRQNSSRLTDPDKENQS